jgi:hypothetical protein
MKRRTNFILTLLLLTSNIVLGQRIDEKQSEVAKQFLYFVLKGNSDSCWELFDKKNVPDVSREQFKSTIDQLKNGLALFDTLELTMTGIRVVNEKKLKQYTFKATSKAGKIVDDVSIDVLFFDSSQFVAGIQPKKLIKENAASTTSGKETSIYNGFTAIVDGVSYKIVGINIVHFANNEGLLAIQVQYALPSDLQSTQKLTKTEAIKFAKYLLQNGYVEKAKIKTREIGRRLLEDIGVSFLDPIKGGGYNVMVKAADYQ